MLGKINKIMFVKGNLVYANAGKYLTLDGVAGYVFLKSEHTPLEREVDISDLNVEGDTASWNKRMFSLRAITEYSFSYLKTRLIHLRYSNDEQIALLLNKDDSEEDALLYQQMQQWRRYASKVAHQIMSVVNEKV